MNETTLSAKRGKHELERRAAHAIIARNGPRYLRIIEQNRREREKVKVSLPVSPVMGANPKKSGVIGRIANLFRQRKVGS